MTTNASQPSVPDTSTGAGEAPHGAGAPESQPHPGAQAQPPAAPPASEGVEPSSPPASPEKPAASPQPRREDGTFTSPTEIPLDQILNRPDVKAELNKQAKLAAKQAMEEAEEKARIDAERAKMDELERLKLEKQEAEQRAVEAARKATEAERERDLANTLIASNLKLANPRALDFLRFNAFGMCDADPNLTMADAVSRVLTEHSYLAAPADAAPAAQPQTPSQPVERPSTAPPTKPTQTPAAAKPEPGVDVLSMSKQEYENYKRRNHPNIH